jgi:hypothetical protein
MISAAVRLRSSVGRRARDRPIHCFLLGTSAGFNHPLARTSDETDTGRSGKRGDATRLRTVESDTSEVSGRRRGFDVERFDLI